MSYPTKNLCVTILLFLTVPALAMQELIEKYRQACATDPIAATVLVHGLNCTPADMQALKDNITALSPKTPVLVADLPEKSFASLETQADALKQQVHADPRFQSGCNIVAHSLGGLASRLALEKGDLPPVLTYCSLGTPHRGVYHMPADSDVAIDDILSHYWRMHPLESLESKLARLACYQVVQQRLSIANIWHDPAQESNYKKYILLAQINNETEHAQAALYRENFQKIRLLVSLVGSREYMVEPTISTGWDYYRVDLQGKKVLEQVEESPLYTTLGIDQLEQRKAFQVIPVRATHAGLRTDKKIFLEHIAPALTRESEKETFLHSNQQPEDQPEQ